jgi:hypothetical protein
LQETSDDLLSRGRLRQDVGQYLRESRRVGKTAVEVSAELLREGLSAEANNLEERARRSINDLKTGVEHAAESVLGDDTEALRFARNELDELSRQLERELAQAQRQSNTNNGSRRREETDRSASATATNRSPQLGGSAQQTGAPDGSEGQPQSRNQSLPEGQQGNESEPTGQARGGGQPGQQAQSGQRGQAGQSGQPQDGSGPGQGDPSEQQSASANQQRGGNQPGTTGQDQAGTRDGERPAGGQGGGGGSFLDHLGGADEGNYAGGPITGAEYTQWSDRLRDVEEMLDVPELRAGAARIRDRVRSARQELKRHAKEPQWDLVKMEIAGPLVELRTRVSEELARRESKEALVPIDRDPVPTRYAELVRRYYEQLGRSDPGKAIEAGELK